MNTRFLTPVKLTKLGVVVCGTLLMGWTRAQTEDQAKGPAREAQMEQRLNDLSARLGLTSAAQAIVEAAVNNAIEAAWPTVPAPATMIGLPAQMLARRRAATSSRV